MKTPKSLMLKTFKNDFLVVFSILSLSLGACKLKDGAKEPAGEEPEDVSLPRFTEGFATKLEKTDDLPAIQFAIELHPEMRPSLESATSIANFLQSVRTACLRQFKGENAPFVFVGVFENGKFIADLKQPPKGTVVSCIEGQFPKLHLKLPSESTVYHAKIAVIVRPQGNP